MRIIGIMRSFVRPVLALIFFMVIYAGGLEYAAAELLAEAAVAQQQASAGAKVLSAGSPAITADFENESDFEEYFADGPEEQATTIADPLEPFNRAMYHFNDKLYFWMLKPVAQGYSKAVPEPARLSVRNFFSNLGFPIRFLSCLIQADLSGAVTEAGRFGINTVWGIGGLLDPAAGKELDLQKQDTDLGLALASYGVGHGFYIVWPGLGPSSPRDSLNIAGEYFLSPVSYITPWYWSAGTRGMEAVNATSLHIGDYEALKQAAIDPYIAMRDAYIQYRLKKIKGKVIKPPAP